MKHRGCEIKNLHCENEMKNDFILEAKLCILFIIVYTLFIITSSKVATHVMNLWTLGTWHGHIAHVGLLP